jgi:hypothetical protein
MKTVWLSSMISSEETVKRFITQAKSYGLEVKGHFWEDDLEKMAWAKARDELIKPDVSLWLILAPRNKLMTPSIRYGLSLLSMTLQAQRGPAFPVAVIQADGELLQAGSLPTLLHGADVHSIADSGMPAKLVANVHTPPKEIASEYRLDVYGNPQIGQWFETGPRNASWHGGMFGVAGGEIALHAVGPRGKLPEQSVIDYPLKGLKLGLGGREYVAWAAQNELTTGSSYFLKVTGFPDSILFGPYSTADEAEVYVVNLK